jgi:uncharacterized protein (DUF4415 family)
MSASRKNTAKKLKPIGSDMAKVDAYVLGPKDYEDIPELTDEWFERAGVYRGDKLIRRGRPASPVRKEPTSIRLDPDVLAYYRRGGPGWQSRINETLRKAAKLPAKPPTTKAQKK